MGLAALIGATALAVACGDDANNNNNSQPPGGGSAGTPAGGTGAGTAGTPAMGGTAAGTAGSGGVAGGGTDMGGTGGATAGTAGTGVAGGGTAGTGGTPPVVVPTQFVIDNIRLAPKGDFGAGGDGAGGAGFGGAGGAPDAMAGAPNDPAAGAAGLGAGGAPPVVLPPQDFFLTFDADIGPLGKNPNGFSPSVAGTGGPIIFDTSTVVWDAAAGKPGGAAKLSVPFSVKNQQADFFGSFTTPNNLAGYELTAAIKMTDTGDVGGDCVAAWMYVYGSKGYANDKSGEPAQGVYSHLVKGQWTKIRLDLDGPYGYHSTANHPNFAPTDVQIWGVQLNTFACP